MWITPRVCPRTPPSFLGLCSEFDPSLSMVLEYSVLYHVFLARFAVPEVPGNVTVTQILLLMQQAAELLTMGACLAAIKAACSASNPLPETLSTIRKHTPCVLPSCMLEPKLSFDPCLAPFGSCQLPVTG